MIIQIVSSSSSITIVVVLVAAKRLHRRAGAPLHGDLGLGDAMTTPSPPTIIVDFRGFDSSIILI